MESAAEMSAELILDRLEGVKCTGESRWLANCPAHNDRHPSLSIKETSEGVVLLKCWSGCTAHEIASAAGISLSELFPSSSVMHRKGERRPFPTADVFRALADEMLFIAMSSCDLIKGKALTETDHQRLLLAVGRVRAALQEGGIK